MTRNIGGCSLNPCPSPCSQRIGIHSQSLTTPEESDRQSSTFRSQAIISQPNLHIRLVDRRRDSFYDNPNCPSGGRIPPRVLDRTLQRNPTQYEMGRLTQFRSARLMSNSPPPGFHPQAHFILHKRRSSPCNVRTPV